MVEHVGGRIRKVLGMGVSKYTREDKDGEGYRRKVQYRSEKYIGEEKN